MLVPVLALAANGEHSVTAVDFIKGRVIVGTASGLLLSQNAQVAEDRIEVTTKHQRLVRSLLPLGDVLLVFTSPNAATGYQLESLEVADGVSMRDVYGGCFLRKSSRESVENLMVFSSRALRLVRINSDSVKLRETIDLPGVEAAACLSRGFVLGSPDGYWFWRKGQDPRVLVPGAGSTKVTPIVAVAGIDAVLIVQGMSSEFPATGTVVSTSGQIREGQVIVWDAYPSSVVIENDLVYAAVLGQLKVHDLTTAREVDIGEIECEQVSLLSTPWTHPDDELQVRFGMALKNESRVAVINKNAISAWFQESRLVRLERQILNNGQVELDATVADTEQGVLEIKYLSLALALQALREYRANSLDPRSLKTALKRWFDGPRFDFHIIQYIYGEYDAALDMFPGLRPIVDDLRSSPPSREFWNRWIQKEYRSHRHPPELFEAYSRIASDDDLVRMALATPRECDLILKEAERQERWSIPERVLEVSGRWKELVRVWIIKVRAGDASKIDQLVEYLQQTHDAELMWNASFELLGLDKDAALRVFTNHKAVIDDSAILSELQERDAVVWRAFLRHLAQSGGKFAVDLAMLVVADIVATINYDSIEQAYSEFFALQWPKPSAASWVTAKLRPTAVGPALEQEWLLLNSSPDPELLSNLVLTLDAQLPCLRAERATVYQLIGLHSQAVELLASIADWTTLLSYSGKDTDLAILVLKSLVSGAPPAVIRDFLAAAPLDLASVLAIAPPDLPAMAIRRFVAEKMRDRGSKVRQAALKHALVRYEAQKLTET